MVEFELSSFRVLFVRFVDFRSEEENSVQNEEIREDESECRKGVHRVSVEQKVCLQIVYQ